MQQGDLVRCWVLETLDEPSADPYAPTVQRDVPRVGIVLEYKSWEKIVTIAFQDTGETGRVAAKDVELIKKSPENSKKTNKNT